VKGQLEDRFDERFGESLFKMLGVRFGESSGKKTNMLQECFNLSQLPSPHEGFDNIHMALIALENMLVHFRRITQPLCSHHD
jgi:hypothetical protein